MARKKKVTPTQEKEKDSKLLAVFGVVSRKKIFLPILLAFLNILALAGIFFISSQFKPTVETPKSEVTKMPRQIKKAPVASPSATLRVPILMYHYVEYVQDKKDTIRESLNINPNIFDEQVKTLKDAGYTFLTASDLADILDAIKPLPPKPVLLTFDDGHWDLYTDVLPILEKYHAKATSYVISGFIGGSDSLSPDQLQKVIQSGLVEIGAHTVHHVALGGRLPEVVRFEVEQSKKTLEENYHIKVVSFAYPDGSFDQQAINTVKAAGFRTAVSTIPGISQNQNNRFYLYRLHPGYKTGKELLDYLSQNNFRPW